MTPKGSIITSEEDAGSVAKKRAQSAISAPAQQAPAQQQAPAPAQPAPSNP